jgi:hypothetical protein
VTEILTPDALVVRGGSIRDPTQLAKAVDRSMNDYGVSALSVFALNRMRNEDDLELKARLIGASKLPHSKVQFSKLSILEKAGFSLELDTSDGQADCHYNVNVEYPPDVEELDRFINVFTKPENRQQLLDLQLQSILQE